MILFRKKLGLIKLKIYPSKASATPPIGPMLGQKGLNINNFCQSFNNKTSSIDSSLLLPVLINYYSDKSYDFFLKNPTISFYLKNILFKNNSYNFLNFLNICDIVKFKISDFNSSNFFSSFKIVLGVLKSMNIFLKI